MTLLENKAALFLVKLINNAKIKTEL